MFKGLFSIPCHARNVLNEPPVSLEGTRYVNVFVLYLVSPSHSPPLPSNPVFMERPRTHPRVQLTPAAIRGGPLGHLL